MGALVSTIMLTALFTIPLTVAAEEYDRFYAAHLVPACEDINRFGTGNTTTGVLVGKCEPQRRSTFMGQGHGHDSACTQRQTPSAAAAVRAVPLHSRGEMPAADTATVRLLPSHTPPDPADGCIVSDQFVAFCADPDRDPVVEYGVRHHARGYVFRTGADGTWNRGFRLQQWLSAGMFVLVLDIFVFLLLVLSLTSVAKPPKTKKEREAADANKHRRGGMNRHNVGDASTHARSRKLDAWHRYGGATMLLGVALLVAGTVFTAMALAEAMTIKSAWLQGQQTCHLAGWTRIKGEELDGAAM